MFIINTGYLFAGLWTCVKPWIDKKTQNKIITKAKSGKKEILMEIDEKNLPEFLYGTCQDPLGFGEFGPWKDAVLTSIKNKTTLHHDQKLIQTYFYSGNDNKKITHD